MKCIASGKPKMDIKMETTMTIPHKMVEIVKGTTARLEFCKSGKLFYSVMVEDTKYTFPIDVTDKDEVGDAKFNIEDKASMFMRYINKAIKALEGDEPDNMIRWEKTNSSSTIGMVGKL
jgi:hypothetical protein